MILIANKYNKSCKNNQIKNKINSNCHQAGSKLKTVRTTILKGYRQGRIKVVRGHRPVDSAGPPIIRDFCRCYFLMSTLTHKKTASMISMFVPVIHCIVLYCIQRPVDTI